MKAKLLRSVVCAVILILLLSGCGPTHEDLDKRMIVVDGQIYELQHRILNTYLLHKIDVEELRKMQQRIDEAKAR